MNTFTVKTHGRSEMLDITSTVREIVSKSGIKQGACLVYCPHTTAGITINENADPDVVGDLLGILEHVVPWQNGYAHAEGNSAAHAKSSLVGCSAWVIIDHGDLVLGTWQSLFFCEFDGPRSRRVHVRLIG